ncbi:hypothetical protein [Bdellovibrio sp. HCB-110]|uniref:hypothetical protein n=1 Tax=Bdellovibrio sp. HCB-110 TaxID=3391182 RepID=UPI0039B64E4C
MNSVFRNLFAVVALFGFAHSSHADVCETVTREEATLASSFILEQVNLSKDRVAYIYDTSSRKTYSVVDGTYAPNTGKKGTDGKMHYKFVFLAEDNATPIELEDFGKAYLAVDGDQKGISLQFLSRCGANYGQDIVIDFPFSAKAE